jgi:AraC-like DNA-binding protein
MSASTLQRRLATEGTTFKALKDQLRREIAIQRLHADRVSLKSLAAELGFADSFAFQRAFKSWTGCPPGAYRRAGR